MRAQDPKPDLPNNCVDVHRPRPRVRVEHAEPRHDLARDVAAHLVRVRERVHERGDRRGGVREGVRDEAGEDELQDGREVGGGDGAEGSCWRRSVGSGAPARRARAYRRE